MTVTLFVAWGTYAATGCGNTIVGATGGDSGTPSGATGPSASGDGSVGSPDGGGGQPAGDGGLVLPDGAPGIAPNGRLLVPSPSASVTVVGVTTDDYVVYMDSSGIPTMAYAISLAPGSSPITLGPLDQDDDLVVSGRVALFESGENNAGVGTLSVWNSSLAKATQLSTTSCSANVGSSQYATSADGKYVLFFDGSDPACIGGTLTVAAVDGSMKTPVVPQVDLSGNLCSLMLAFGGDRGVAGYCVTGGDGGVVIDASLPEGGSTVNVATVSSFTGPAWPRTPVVVGAQPGVAVDPSGTEVVLVGANGTAAYPIGGGPPVSIDPNGELGNVSSKPGFLVNDGGTLLYTTTNLALARASTTVPATPTLLSDAGAFTDILFVSPDERWVIGTFNTSYYPDSDLYLAPAGAPGPTITLSSQLAATITGDAFTADSSHALYLTAVTKKQNGTLNAAPVAGGAPTVVATNAVAAYAVSGTKIIVDGDFDPNEGTAGVYVADVATTAPPRLLVSLANPYPFMNAARTSVIYTWSYETGASSGIWVLDVP